MELKPIENILIFVLVIYLVVVMFNYIYKDKRSIKKHIFIYLSLLGLVFYREYKLYSGGWLKPHTVIPITGGGPITGGVSQQHPTPQQISHSQNIYRTLPQDKGGNGGNGGNWGNGGNIEEVHGFKLLRKID